MDKILETILGLAVLGIGMVFKAKEEGIPLSLEAKKFGKGQNIKEYKDHSIDEQINNYRRESNPYSKTQMLKGIQDTINRDVNWLSGNPREAIAYCEKHLRNCPDNAVRSMLEKKKVMLERQIEEQSRKENIRFSKK